MIKTNNIEEVLSTIIHNVPSCCRTVDLEQTKRLARLHLFMTFPLAKVARGGRFDVKLDDKGFTIKNPKVHVSSFEELVKLHPFGIKLNMRNQIEREDCPVTGSFGISYAIRDGDGELKKEVFCPSPNVHLREDRSSNLYGITEATDVAIIIEALKALEDLLKGTLGEDRSLSLPSVMDVPDEVMYLIRAIEELRRGKGIIYGCLDHLMQIVNARVDTDWSEVQDTIVYLNEKADSFIRVGV